VVGSSFNPSAAGAGINNIVYNYTDNYGCSNSDTVAVMIKPLPTIVFSIQNDVCENASPVTLTNISPSGGSFTGTAISANGLFYPSIAGTGTHTLYYHYTDSNGCSNSDTAVINVRSVPTATFSVPPYACINDSSAVIYTGNADSAAVFNWNFDSANVISGSGAGPFSLSWNTAGLKQLSLTVTDSGCTSATSSSFINVLSTYANITAAGNTSVCFGDSVTLFANTGPGFSYQWFDSSGIIIGDTLPYLVTSTSGNYYCQITPPNGCSAFSNSIFVNIKPQIVSDFSLPASACRDDMVSINFNGTAPAGAVYSWNFDSATIASGSGAGPYSVIWFDDSIKTVSLMVSKDGCSSVLTEKDINILSTHASVTALGSTSFCNGDSVTLTSNAGNYSYSWFFNGNATGDSLAMFTAFAAGAYQVKVTDNNTGCSDLSDSLNITVNTTNFNLAFTANPTSFSLPPFNTQFTNQTPSANNYYWSWSFGDGNVSSNVNPVHMYNYDGTYTVGVVAQNINTGCYDTLVKPNYISCNGGNANPCTLNTGVGSNGQHQVCPGDSVKLWSMEHSSGVSYQWLKDGVLIPGKTDSVFYASMSGNYQVMVSDTACSVFSQPYSITQYTVITPVILSNGSIQPCSGDSMELYVATAFASYQWSNGASTPNIFIKSSSSYLVTATDVNDCKTTSLPFVVNASYLSPPQICIVGVDSATNHNVIVWERQNSSQIDSFRIYRESTTAGIYDLIGSQSFGSSSVFEDTSSNTAVMSYRYRITAVDTCGMETAPGNFHRTIHLTINAGLNGTWNLLWNNYEGFSFGSYRIYRGSDSSNLQLLTQIQSSLNSYTDLNPPAGNVYYQIEVMSPHPCYPDSIYSKAKTNYNTSRSNKVNTAMAPNTGFVTAESSSLKMSIMPNPNNGRFTLLIDNAAAPAEGDYTIEVYDITGSLLHSEVLSSGRSVRKTLHLEHLNKGLYFIRLKTKNNLLTTRFVVQ
jgi:PKD repeat protein